MTEVRTKSVKALIRQFEAQKKRIAKERDNLRELIYELEDIDSGCEDAVFALDEAADAMSRIL